MYIEVSDYYDSRVNIDIERFYQLPFQDSEMVLQEAYELYNKTRQWAIDAGIYEGSDVYYNRTLDILSYKMPYQLNTHGNQENNNLFITLIRDLYRQLNSNFIGYLNTNERYKLNSIDDIILVIRGSYDYQMFQKQEPLDNIKLENILRENNSLNKKWLNREKLNNNIYKNSKPFQVVNNKMKNKNTPYLCLEYGELNSKIMLPFFHYDRKKLDPNIEITEIELNRGYKLYNENEADFYVNYPMNAYIFKPATFSEIIAFVMARRFPLK